MYILPYLPARVMRRRPHPEGGGGWITKYPQRFRKAHLFNFRPNKKNMFMRPVLGKNRKEEALFFSSKWPHKMAARYIFPVRRAIFSRWPPTFF